jgi:magnesium-transporting ATPase (P-type)
LHPHVWGSRSVPGSELTPERAWQGPSPDEVALVEGGRQLGFEFVERSRDTLTLQILGHRVNHQVLNTLDYTSSRARCVS